MAWMINYTISFVKDTITHSCPFFNCGGLLKTPMKLDQMGNFIAQIYICIIIYPCPNLDAGLAILCGSFY